MGEREIVIKSIISRPLQKPAGRGALVFGKRVNNRRRMSKGVESIVNEAVSERSRWPGNKRSEVLHARAQEEVVQTMAGRATRCTRDA